MEKKLYNLKILQTVMLLSCLQDTTQLILSAMVIGTLKLSGGTLTDHKFLFLGAGEAKTRIAKLMALEMSKQTMSIL